MKGCRPVRLPLALRARWHVHLPRRSRFASLPPPVRPCPGDVDRSGSVNGVDLAIVLTNWGTPNQKHPGADTDGDGAVNGVDLATVLAGWGACP
jgi:hypothetical protein